MNKIEKIELHYYGDETQRYIYFNKEEVINKLNEIIDSVNVLVETHDYNEIKRLSVKKIELPKPNQGEIVTKGG